MKQTKKRWLIAALGLGSSMTLLLPLTSCSAEIDGVTSNEIINQIFPNVWVFIAQIIAMIILLSLIIWLVWKPANRWTDKRKDHLMREVEQTKKAKEEAFSNFEKSKEEQIRAQAQAIHIVNAANDEGYKIRERLEVEAKANARRIQNEAKDEALKQEEKLRQDMQKEIINVAFSAAEALIKKEINKKDNQRLVDDFIKNIDKNLAQHD